MAYITKPFKPSDLIPAIQIAIARSEEIAALEQEIADLSDRLETRKLMDRAKGLLMSKMKLSEPDAFRWIQKASMDRRLSMAQVAKAVIDQLGQKSASDEENS
jgi:response regulator NasT